MILYKYVSFGDGCHILNGKSIGYSHPWDFNDPFEMGGGHGVLPDSAFTPLVFKTLMETSAILALTRSPLNPLMWAHYSNNHGGFVIGWDAETGGFTDESKNLIPAQYGNVIYTATRPIHRELGPSAPMRYGREYAFRSELFEKLQRLFLYKALCWSYEEEVRAVKCVHGDKRDEIPSGPLMKIERDGRPLYLATFPSEAIKEVYLGVNNPILTADEDPAILQSWKATAKLWECRLSADSWTLDRVEYAC